MPYTPPLGNPLNNLGILFRITRTNWKNDLPLFIIWDCGVYSLVIPFWKKTIYLIDPIDFLFLSWRSGQMIDWKKNGGSWANQSGRSQREGAKGKEPKWINSVRLVVLNLLCLYMHIYNAIIACAVNGLTTTLHQWMALCAQRTALVNGFDSFSGVCLHPAQYSTRKATANGLRHTAYGTALAFQQSIQINARTHNESWVRCNHLTNFRMTWCN